MFTRKLRKQVLPPQSVSCTTCVHQSLTAPLLLTRPGPDPADVNAICQSLTARQRDVLAVLLQGKSNKAICRVLNLAEPTVKNHVTAILKALKVTNRTEAVIRVNNAGTALVSFASTTPRHQDARRSHAAVTDSASGSSS
jgi:DNA-binding NarL/FixJ family response regulator